MVLIQTESFPITSFVLNSNTLVITFPDSSEDPFTFNLVVYLSGDSEFFEGTASIPSGTNVQADFNHLGEIEISSGDVVAAME